MAQVRNKAGGPFTRDDEELLAALPAQAFIALDNARLFESVVTTKNYSEMAERAEAGEAVRELLDAKHNATFVGRLDACARAGAAHTESELKYVLTDEESGNVNVSVVPRLDSKRQPLGVVWWPRTSPRSRLMSTLCRYVTREIAEEIMKRRWCSWRGRPGTTPTRS